MIVDMHYSINVTDAQLLALQEAKCGYLMLLMGAFWCLQVLPLSVTALMPVVIVPLFGIQSAKDVIHNYMRVSPRYCFPESHRLNIIDASLCVSMQAIL